MLSIYFTQIIIQIFKVILIHIILLLVNLYFILIWLYFLKIFFCVAIYFMQWTFIYNIVLKMVGKEVIVLNLLVLIGIFIIHKINLIVIIRLLFRYYVFNSSPNFASFSWSFDKAGSIFSLLIADITIRRFSNRWKK